MSLRGAQQRGNSNLRRSEKSADSLLLARPPVAQGPPCLGGEDSCKTKPISEGVSSVKSQVPRGQAGDPNFPYTPSLQYSNIPSFHDSSNAADVPDAGANRTKQTQFRRSTRREPGPCRAKQSQLAPDQETVKCRLEHGLRENRANDACAKQSHLAAGALPAGPAGLVAPNKAN